MGEGVPSLFQPLVESAVTSNPRVFSIPYEMQRRDILPGEISLIISHDGGFVWEGVVKELKFSCLLVVCQSVFIAFLSFFCYRQ